MEKVLALKDNTDVLFLDEELTWTFYCRHSVVFIYIFYIIRYSNVIKRFEMYINSFSGEIEDHYYFVT